jgi:hypothetical protein
MRLMQTLMSGTGNLIDWRAERMLAGPSSSHWRVVATTLSDNHTVTIAAGLSEEVARILASAPALLKAAKNALGAINHDWILSAQQIRDLESAVFATEPLIPRATQEGESK